MPTNKIVVKTSEEILTGFTPIYRPLFGILMNRAKQYPAEVGKVDFRHMDVVGDIRAKHITPKDTEIKQIAVGDGKKTFSKYFLANQFTVSTLQGQDGVEDVNNQVLDEHNKQMDELVLFGDSQDSGTTVVNNGLFYSKDANYVLENSKAIAAGTAADHLRDLYTQIMATKIKSDVNAGQKVLILYGDTLIAKYSSLYATTDAPFADVLGKAIGQGWSVVLMPSDVTPANANGWIAVNMDQIQFNYTKLPGVEGQGVNEEKMYVWTNFLLGSAMLEVLVSKGIIRQPVTFA